LVVTDTESLVHRLLRRLNLKNAIFCMKQSVED